MKPKKPNRTTPTKRAMRGASRKNDGALSREADRPERLRARIMELEVELRSRDQAASDARAELAKALAQQMATSEILRTISRSPTGVQPIFESVVSSVARLCDATDVGLVLVEDNAQRVTAWMGPFFEEWRSDERRLPIARGTVSGRAILDQMTVHVHDVAEVPEEEYPVARALQRRFGTRTMLAVPLLRNGVSLGVIVAVRTQVLPFTERQIDLVETFADQAVIAIENVRLFKELEARNRELSEALEQQTATSEILRVISSSPTDIQPVMDAVAKGAVRLCQAFDAIVARRDGDDLVLVAHDGPIPSRPIGDILPLTRGAFARRAVLDGRTVHVADAQAAAEEFPEGSEVARRLGFRTVLAVPLMRDDVAIGALLLRRSEARLFDEQQIALLQTFAHQAVIAIENVRLFKELESRNGELTTALDRQTATSEILRVISSSPTDVQPVFDAIVRSGVTLCSALLGTVFRLDGDMVHLVGIQHPTPEVVAALYPAPVTAPLPPCRALRDNAIIHVPDTEAEGALTPEGRRVARLSGLRSLLSVPMRREGGPIGAILVARPTLGLFPDEQIALLQTFADQAVIAIENVRLFTELQEKNRALTQAHAQVTEALEQQTATAEILRVISSSPTDVQPTFEAIAASATRLCAAGEGTLFRFDGTLIHLAAHCGLVQNNLVRHVFPRPVGPGSVTARAILTRSVIHIPDVTTDPDLERSVLITAGFRTVLSVPMLRDGDPIGAITVSRQTVAPFSDAQIALLQTFADQAVIAIENVRLFTELRSSNRELRTALDTQTATSDILRVISSSPTETQPVFDAIAESATRLCGGLFGSVYRFDGTLIHMVAHHNYPAAALEFSQRTFPARPSRQLFTTRAILTAAPVNVPDVQRDPDYVAHDVVRAAGFQSVLSVPMRRAGMAVGAITVWHAHVEGFTDQHVTLLETFADQAVIAIENVRLFTELQEKNRALTQAHAQVTETLDQQTATSEVLRVIAGSPTDLQPVLDTLVESAGRLCQAADTFLLLIEGDQLRVAALHGAVDEGARLSNAIHRGWVAGRAVVDARTVHVEDLANAEAEFPLGAAIAARFGHRTALAIPLLRKGVPIGALFLRRREVRQFSDKEIALLETFADQAVIAIENVRLFKEIEEKSHQLEIASQHKSEFLANMSHELRTPLNAIIGFSEVLSERMFGDLNEKQEEYLKDIYASGTHLLSLINDILDLSKIEAGRMELELTDFDLPQAIDNALTLVRERASRGGIALHQSVEEHLGEIRGDERKVKQVLLNLLSNALKFTPEGGRVEVLARVVSGMAEISVSDTGVGIAAEDQEAVFEEFRQVGAAEKKAEGTGLGLTLCRKFIELHGGKIWVTSQVGVGSTFTFTIPVRSGK